MKRRYLSLTQIREDLSLAPLLNNSMEWINEEEVLAMLDISSCNEAIEKWNPDFWRCPCCLATHDNDGYITHRPRIIH